MLLLKEKEQGTKLFFKLYGIFNMETNELLGRVIKKEKKFFIGNFKYEQTVIEDFYSIDIEEKIKLENKEYNFENFDGTLNFVNDKDISTLITAFLKPDKIIIPYNDLLLNKNLNSKVINDYLKKLEKVDENCFVIPNTITNTILLGKNKEKYELIINLDLKLL